MTSRATYSSQELPPYTLEVFEELKRCAADGSTITYGILAKNVGGVGARPESVFPALNYIRDHVCLPRELPWLWMLAVNRKGQPGGGAWTNTGVTLRDDEHWNEILRSVYECDWSDIEIEDQ